MKPTTTRMKYLIVSHILAAVLGSAIGYAYDWRYGKAVEFFGQMIAERPQSDAARLAFRYGNPDQARSILSAIPVFDTSDPFHWNEMLGRDIRFLILCREQRDSNCADQFLASAVEDCRRLKRSPCTPDYLNKFADMIARDRRASVADDVPRNSRP